MGAVRFTVLGPVTMEINGETVSLPRAQTRAILSLLVLHPGHAFSIEAMVEAMWGGAAPATARSQIQISISMIRRALAGAGVRVDGGIAGYRLVGDNVQIDAAELEAHLVTARTAEPAAAVRELRSALALWRGTPLADARGAFVDGARARLTEVFLQANEDLADVELARGGHAEILPLLLTRIEQYPLRERLRSRLMLALHRAGRQAEALETFRQYRQLVADQLGLDPGAEIAALELSILRNDPQLDVPVLAPASGNETGRAPVRLPPRVTHFVGRADALAWLGSQLNRTDVSAPRSVVLTGMSGAGKTALATRFAYDVADRFPDGVVLVEMHGFDERRLPLPVHDAMGQVLLSLGVAEDDLPVDESARLGRYRADLHHRHVLLIFDDVATTAQVEPMLPPGDSSFTLVTSRDHLEGLVARHASMVLRVGPLGTDDAIDLLRRMTAGVPGAADEGMLRALAEACGNLPLAVRTVAMRILLESISLNELAGLLRDEAKKLSALDLDRQSSGLRAAFAVSHHALTPGAAATFRELGILPGGPTALPAAASAMGLSINEMRPALAELARAGMVELIGDDRYDLHDLLRAYAVEKHAEAGGTDTSVRRLLDYYLDGVDRADRIIRPMRQRPHVRLHHPPTAPAAISDESDALSFLDNEYANLLHAVQYAADHGWHEVTWQLADGLYSYHMRRRRITRWLHVDTLGLAAAQALDDTTAHRRMRTGIAACLALAHRYDEAFDHLTVALALAEEQGDDATTASVHTMLSGVYGESGRFQECERHALVAYEIYSRLGQIRPALTCLHNVGMSKYDRRDHAGAIEVLSSVVAQGHTHLADEQELAEALAALAGAYLESGDLAAARDAGSAALEAARRLQHQLSIADALLVLGRCDRDADRAAARQSLHQALDLYRELDHPGAARARKELDLL